MICTFRAIIGHKWGVLIKVLGKLSAGLTNATYIQINIAAVCSS